MRAQHISHKPNEWFEIVDEDPDCDFETGQYVGFRDMIKFNDGRWYPKKECYYIDRNDDIKSCCS